MKICIENIGIVKNAQVIIDGITVIAGENDSGKSTVGKVLYSIMNTFSKFNSEKSDNQNRFITKYLQKALAELESEKPLYNDIESYIIQHSDFRKTDIEKIQDKIMRELAENSKVDREAVSKHFNKIYEMYTHEKQTIFIKKLLEGKFLSEFNGQINNLLDESGGTIRIDKSDKDLLSLTFDKNTINSLKIDKYSFFENVFLIDSPFIIDDFDRLIKRGLFTEADKIFDDKKSDLIYRLKNKAETDIFSREEYNGKIKLVEIELKKIISGSFDIDSNGLKYVLKNKEISVNNMAAGLKIYTIIKMLIENYWLSTSSLFIFDEPEIHLHPQWQLALAEILVMLSSTLNIHILVNTHSPYFLRAIQIYTKKYCKEDRANYYFAEKICDFKSQIQDVKEDLGSVYATLSKPFEDLQELENLYQI